jgi:hypothetical protein
MNRVALVLTGDGDCLKSRGCCHRCHRVAMTLAAILWSISAAFGPPMQTWELPLSPLHAVGVQDQFDGGTSALDSADGIRAHTVSSAPNSKKLRTELRPQYPFPMTATFKDILTPISSQSDLVTVRGHVPRGVARIDHSRGQPHDAFIVEGIVIGENERRVSLPQRGVR